MVNPTTQTISRTGNTPTQPAIIADDPQVIRAQIESIRAEMGRTLDEIQVKLSPDFIKQQTQDSIREATIEKVENMAQIAEYKVNNWRANAVHTVKENPIPTALIGIGIGWLLLSDSNGRSDEYPAPYKRNMRSNDPYAYAGGRGVDNYYGRGEIDETDPSLATEAQMRAADAAESAQEWASDTASDAQQKAQNAAATVKHQATATTETVRDNVSGAAESAQEYVAETAEQARVRAEQTRLEAQRRAEQAQIQARRQVRHAKRSFWQTMEENPLAIGTAAAAAGALIGLALPSTEKENELMGETRDRLVQDASSTMQETVQKVQTVAETTAKTAVAKAKQEAEKQNLPTPETTGETAKQKAAASA